MKALFCLLCMAIGVIAGAMLGRHLAHEAPLFGGIAMFGEPGSPARQALVPGHVALLGTAGGLLGLALGVVRELMAPRTPKIKRSRRELPSKIDSPD